MAHRLMGEPRVAQSAVNGSVSVEYVEIVGVEKCGVDDMRLVQKNAVEVERVVGDEGGVDGLLG